MRFDCDYAPLNYGLGVFSQPNYSTSNTDVPNSFLFHLYKVKKIQKIQTNWKWVGGSRSHSDKKTIGKSSQKKVLRLYNSPLLGGARGTSRCACMQHCIPYSVIL